MGTRSLTIVHDGLKKDSPRIITMYKQYDGYPEGYGTELANFLSQFTMVNGFGLSEKRKIANGTGCLAAQIVAHFKTEVGGIYLQPCNEADTPGDSGEEYIYEVFADTFDTKKGIRLICYDVYEKKVIYDGKPADFELAFTKAKA